MACKSVLSTNPKQYAVISEGTNSGFHYRVILKTFRTQPAAERYAARMNAKESTGFFYVEAV